MWRNRLLRGGAVVASALSLVAAQPPPTLPDDPREAVALLESCTARGVLVERLALRTDVTSTSSTSWSRTGRCAPAPSSLPCACS